MEDLSVEFQSAALAEGVFQRKIEAAAGQEVVLASVDVD